MALTHNFSRDKASGGMNHESFASCRPNNDSQEKSAFESTSRPSGNLNFKHPKVSFSPEVSISVTSPVKEPDEIMSDGAYSVSSDREPRHRASFKVVLIGESTLDRRFTPPMLPWIVLEVIQKKSRCMEINLQLTEDSLKATVPQDDEVLFEHKLKYVYKFSKTHHNHSCFMYLTRDSAEAPFKCFVYRAESESEVLDLFSMMKEITKEIIQQQQHSVGLLADVSTTDSLNNYNISTENTMHDAQHYEVLYIGKIKVSHKRAPPTFIDDAVEEFKVYETEKRKQQRDRHGSGASITSLPGNIEQKVTVQENNLVQQRDCLESNDSLSSGSDASLCMSISRSESSDVFPPAGANDKENQKPAIGRMRSFSGDNVLCKVSSDSTNGNDMDFKGRPRVETWPMAPSFQRQQNRTMLFLIGKSEVCMISPDKKSALLAKSFRDISHCSQGINHSDHFGFICRDTNLEGYISYIFKCQSEQVVDDIMIALKQAFKSAHLQQQQHLGTKTGSYVICNTCPMHWLHKVCIEIEGLNSERTYAVLMKKLEHLSEYDQNEIIGKLNGAEVATKQQKCEILMILLMAMCRSKQMRHKHSNLTDNTKPEFHIGDRRQSAFDNLRKKAKKSLTSSFENMLKRRSKEDVRDSVEKEIDDSNKKPNPQFTSHHWKSFDDAGVPESSSPLHYTSSLKSPMRTNSSSSVNTKSADEAGTVHQSSKNATIYHSNPSLNRGRSTTISTVYEAEKDFNSSHRNANNTSPKSSFMNIFMKVGNPVKSPSLLDANMSSSSIITPKKGSWRQAIFQRVVTPVKTDNNLRDAPKSAESNALMRTPLTKEDIRALWRKVILQQITLIRMEKENKKLQVQQDASSSKRMKLDYEEITPCLKEVTKIWDEMINSDRSVAHDRNAVYKAVKDGVPRQKRADIWLFLANQACLHKPNSTTNHQLDVDINTPYKDLLKELTSHQHAILIDLGRTFPSHPYYARPLGPGQLGLFNLLKAYSLLDKDVGYCQGLSFVAGILLLHMEEESAFNMMKQLMFHQGMRRQYKPDMVALQVQMYQLSRLIHDHHRDLYEHFELHEIAPTLYAAPWFLTLFASQFPLGFVSRLFDILLLQDFEVVFKVALILLGNHKELIMQCNGFEQIMEFLKTTLPSLGIIQMERVFNQVFTLDISKQLHAFEVEYHVLQEEMIVSPHKTEAAYQNLRRQNMELVEQLQLAHSNIHNLEHSIGSYQETIDRLQSKVKSLELEKTTLQRTIVKIGQENPNILADDTCKNSNIKDHKQNDQPSSNDSSVAQFSTLQGSNDSSSFDDDDSEVAMTFNNSNNDSVDRVFRPPTISPGVEK